MASKGSVTVGRYDLVGTHVALLEEDTVKVDFEVCSSHTNERVHFLVPTYQDAELSDPSPNTMSARMLPCFTMRLKD